MSHLITPTQLLEIFEGNRRLTIRTVEAFPEKELFEFAPSPTLRPFARMVKEILDIETTSMEGIATGKWDPQARLKYVTTKQGLLEACEAVRRNTRELWPRVAQIGLLTEAVEDLFGTGPQINLDRLLYVVENEIHHRGEGFVYLRLLGIEPPVFYRR